MTTASLTRTDQPAITDEQEFRLLFAATFVIFLAAVVIMRIGRLIGGRPAGSLRSIFAEARETGSSTLRFAFMG